MRKLKRNLLKIIFISLVMVLLPCGFASANILFYEDFEDELDTVADPYRDWIYETEGTGSMELSTEQVRYGSKSYKFSCTGSADHRVRQEIQLRKYFNEGTFHFIMGREYWVGFSIYLAEGYKAPSDPGTWCPMHHQYHTTRDSPPTCDPIEIGRHGLAIKTKGENWFSWVHWDTNQCTYDRESIEGAYYTHDPFVVGQWTDFVINVVFDYDEDGFLKIWKDGELIVNHTSPTWPNDDLGPFFKQGIYAWLDEGQVVTVYIDEYRLGDSDSSYAEVAPRGTVPSSTCQSQGYQCCSSCKSGAHSEYDSDCSNQVCCEVCANTGNSIPKTNWTLKYADSEELVGENGAAINSFDDDVNTIWHTEWYGGDDPQPHEIQINLNKYYDLTGLKYLPRQDGDDNGRINNYEFYTSTDGNNWDLTSTGTFADNANEQEVLFKKQEGIKYIKLKTLSAYDNDPWTSMAEINLLGTISCTESWQCTTWSVWSECLGNQQSRTRTCTDSNNCGTENNKPSETETQFCESPTTYGISNFIQLVSDWLKSEPPNLESDINNDGAVNTRDLGIMMSNWGE